MTITKIKFIDNISFYEFLNEVQNICKFKIIEPLSMNSDYTRHIILYYGNEEIDCYFTSKCFDKIPDYFSCLYSDSSNDSKYELFKSITEKFNSQLWLNDFIENKFEIFVRG